LFKFGTMQQTRPLTTPNRKTRRHSLFIVANHNNRALGGGDDFSLTVRGGPTRELMTFDIDLFQLWIAVCLFGEVIQQTFKRRFDSSFGSMGFDDQSSLRVELESVA